MAATKSVFVAKFDYVCDICKGQHKAGTRTIYTDNKQLAAADCRWPNKNRANPIPITDRKQAGNKPFEKGLTENAGRASPQEPSVVLPRALGYAQIEDMLRRCEEQASKRMGTSDYADIQYVEYVKLYFNAELQKQEQEFSLGMSRAIQQAKAENIKRVQQG